jgi:hypothetical protein
MKVNQMINILQASDLKYSRKQIDGFDIATIYIEMQIKQKPSF